MAQITLIYPDTWLSISVSVINTTTNAVDFIGTAVEVWSTMVYLYDFVEAPSTDYVYIATVLWYSAMRGIIYQDSASSGLGGLTPTQAAQLESTVKTGDTILNLGDISIPL